MMNKSQWITLGISFFFLSNWFLIFDVSSLLADHGSFRYELRSALGFCLLIVSFAFFIAASQEKQ